MSLLWKIEARIKHKIFIYKLLRFHLLRLTIYPFMLMLPAWVRKAFWSWKLGTSYKPTPIKYYVFHFEIEWCTMCIEVQWHLIGHCNTLLWYIISIKSGLMMFVNLTIKGENVGIDIRLKQTVREKGEPFDPRCAMIGSTPRIHTFLFWSHVLSTHTHI